MRTLSLTAALLISPTLAAAQALTYTVNLTEDSPTYDRFGDQTRRFAYQAIPITVGDGQNFYLEATGGTLDDGYMYVYSTFDPLNPRTNIVLSDDDSGEDLLPAITGRPLTNGDYVVVVTSYNEARYGSIIFDIFGITLNLGPTVSEMAEDLALRHGQYLLASSASRSRAISAATRSGNSNTRLTASSKGTGEILTTLPDIRGAWATVSYQSMNGAVSGQLSQVQAGVDQELQTGGLLGLSLAYENVSSQSDEVSAKGNSITVLPYLAFNMGSVDAAFAISYGVTTFSEYMADTVDGAAKAKNIEISADFGRSFALNETRSIRPYIGLALGRSKIDFENDLAEADNISFSTRRASVGVEIEQEVSTGGLLPGSAITGRMELSHASHNGPDTSFAITGPQSDLNTATIGLGGIFQTSGNSQIQLEAVANGIGSGDVVAGLSGSLSIKF